MAFGRLILGSALVLLTIPCSAASHARRGPTSHRLFGRHASHATTFKPASQRSIDDGRATEIQTALIGAGYLSGSATGHWDSSTESAMQKFQADNGWQTKLIPDSRAIIKLGLGPNQEEQSSYSPAPPPAEPIGGAVLSQQ